MHRPRSPRHRAPIVSLAPLAPLAALAALAAGCGDGDDEGVDPTTVRFGDTALVVVVNPIVNDSTRDPVPAPGPVRRSVVLSSDDGITDVTGGDGIAVLAPLTPGRRTIRVEGDAIDASFTVTLTQGALHEIALAADGARADVMVALDYKVDNVVEVSPAMTNAQVNAALAQSDRVVFLAGGEYIGNLDFSGSRVTLFGEGALGGRVTILGDVTVSGSDSRVRGARITGRLNVPASGTGLSFSRVESQTSATGSDATFLANALCGGASITGSGAVAVDNIGTAPIAACP